MSIYPWFIIPFILGGRLRGVLEAIVMRMERKEDQQEATQERRVERRVRNEGEKRMGDAERKGNHGGREAGVLVVRTLSN
mmetsp:Transcript_8948/g.18015  ORF Transcript_8948/g.18015 Transcript_8948/m.18015 type:complete len:80 (-) Transcript_8948:1319-1558(-)